MNVRATSGSLSAAGAPALRFYSVPDAAKLIGTAPVTLYRAIRDGEFPAVRIRGRLIIPARVLEEMVSAAVADQCAVDAAHWATSNLPAPRTRKEAWSMGSVGLLILFAIGGAFICAKSRSAGGAVVFAGLALVMFVATPVGQGGSRSDLDVPGHLRRCGDAGAHPRAGRRAAAGRGGWAVMAGGERVSPAEIAALAARLRALSAAGSDVDEWERARFLADKERLIARIEAGRDRQEDQVPADAGRGDVAAGAADGVDALVDEWPDDRPDPWFCHEPGDGVDDGDSGWGVS